MRQTKTISGEMYLVPSWSVAALIQLLGTFAMAIAGPTRPTPAIILFAPK
jgi:hypothetical protein